MADAYVDSMLGEGEVIQAEARQHWMALIRFALQPILVFIAALVCLGIGTWLNPSADGGLFNDIFRFIDTVLGWITVGLFVLALVWFPIQIVRWIKRRYLVTNRRVLYIEGVLRRNSRDAGLKMITDVGFRQTFIGRKLGFGDLTIATAANRPLHFREMRDAIAFKKVIMAAQLGTLEARADEILGKPAGVPSVAAVATAIDPASFPPPAPAWDGSDVPEMTEDDIPPADPEIFGSAAIAVPAEPASEAVVAAVAASTTESVAAPEIPAIDAPAVEAPEAPVVETPVAAPEAPAAALAGIDSVIAASDPEPVTGAAAVTEALARLADLRDSGAITDDEFEAKKQELLDRL